MADATIPTIPVREGDAPTAEVPVRDEITPGADDARPETPRPRGGVPISIRVVAICVLLLAAALLVAAGLTVRQTRAHLTSQLDDRLAAAVESFKDDPAQRVVQPEQLATEARAWLAAQAFPHDQVVAFRTEAGEVLTTTGGLELTEIERSRELLTARESRWWNVDGDNGPVRALTVPLTLEGEQAGTIVAAADRSDVDDTLATLLSSVALASGIALLVVTVLAFLAVRRTLRPLTRMAGDVQAIEASGDHSRRVAPTGSADEVGRLTDSFNRMLASLEDSYRSQQQFLSDASHELRTPLTVARGRLELLSDELHDDSARQALAVATDEIDRMGRIVEELLLLARLDEGLPLRREPVEIELLLQEALLRAPYPMSRAARVDAEPELSALADHDRLLQVLSNLVTNAVQHAGHDASLTLTAWRTGDRAVIEVADTGAGIAAADLSHVFERFHRGGPAGTGVPGGAGLGLAIAASLVRAMDGEISVRSMPGAGTTFTVSLPTA
ncbi:MAG: sensor histidine kinase [Actinomycetota bacterium]